MSARTQDPITTMAAALGWLSPDCDRSTWVRIGMSIKAALGDAGFDIWDSWSQGADSYRQDDARAAWRSFRTDGKVQAGTLFHMALQAGWEPNGEAVPTLPPPTPKTDPEAERRALLERQRHAAQKAFTLWRQAPAVKQHPYLTAKLIKPHGVRLFRGALLVPLYDGPGRLINLQFIKEDGKKRYLAGGRKSGCYWWIGETVTDTLCMAEGYATAASIHEATGLRCYIAFDAGNLIHVGEAIRAQFPGARLVLCADHDADGIKYATRTAARIGAAIALPDLPGHDFNDMARADHGRA
ncbi:toprim domain-containing protein [Candidatus Methylospira mobilis]|uniref:Toprim domain-containing protein n=1 Tax=Candidatus Methylospira mobilis TaxID=1808979 RepID=A0A5Q0BL22_9GAMM|nr:PriCT-2 domain-containing protein [Candidatus Methylospira mobilis]QFY44635.1 toprim domain-containing protein [Candidatus Methylospira mobilis]